MKELIRALVMVGTLMGGSSVLKSCHDRVREAALEKASQGIPSLRRSGRPQYFE